MKTTLQLLFLMLICSQLHAQIVNIPDPVFKQRIIDNGVDTNFDGEIQVTEAEALTGLLDVNGQFDDISDLTGIEAFVNITALDCWLNSLTTIDLSQNINLVRLKCMDNPLTSLNVTQCIALELLEAEHTNLSDIDLSNNMNLSIIAISDADLISLDLTNNSNLESISLYNINPLNFLDIRTGNNINISSFGSYLNPNLKCIFVDDKNYWETNFGSNIDPTSHFVETQAQCDALGVNYNQLQNIQIYPNPVKNTLYIDTNSEFRMSNSQLVIRDVLGKSVFKTKISKQTSEINIAQLKSGIYFLHLNNIHNQLIKRIIKL